MVLGQLALALGALGRFAGFQLGLVGLLLVLLGSRVRTRFLNVPDAPVSKFQIKLCGGKK